MQVIVNADDALSGVSCAMDSGNPPSYGISKPVEERGKRRCRKVVFVKCGASTLQPGTTLFAKAAVSLCHASGQADSICDV